MEVGFTKLLNIHLVRSLSPRICYVGMCSERTVMDRNGGDYHDTKSN